MSGHSKWSTIKRKKGAIDAKRSKMFSRISKEIAIAVKEGGSGDTDANSRLRLAVQNAKGVNMPKENIQRAISRADRGENLEESTFEGYGPSGIAIFVECLSDNNNRTVSNVRSAFNKHGGSLGTNGSLSFLFSRKGIFRFSLPKGELSEELEMELISAGAEEIDTEAGEAIVTTALEDFGNMSKKLEELQIEAESQALERVPKSTTVLPVSDAQKVLKLVEILDEDDDVQNVFHNLELTDEILAACENE